MSARPIYLVLSLYPMPHIVAMYGAFFPAASNFLRKLISSLPIAVNPLQPEQLRQPADTAFLNTAYVYKTGHTPLRKTIKTDYLSMSEFFLSDT